MQGLFPGLARGDALGKIRDMSAVSGRRLGDKDRQTQGMCNPRSSPACHVSLRHVTVGSANFPGSFHEETEATLDFRSYGSMADPGEQSPGATRPFAL